MTHDPNGLDGRFDLRLVFPDLGPPPPLDPIREQVKALEAGREMDALVAIHVFGYTWRAFPNGRALKSPETIAPEASLELPIHPNQNGLSSVPEFSTDPRWAWHIAEELSLWICPSSNAHGWASNQLALEEPTPEGGYYGDTMPLAVCRAALAWALRR